MINMRKLLLNILKLLFTVCIISSPVLLFWSITPLIAGAYIVFVVVPITLFMLRTLLMQTIKNCGKPEKKNSSKGKKEVNLREYQAIKEIWKQEREPLYLKNRNLFRDLMKEGKLTRDDILQLRNLVEGCLGDLVDDYKGMKFNNDCHRLYTYFKNYSLNERDWQKINQFLNRITNVERTTKEESI
jgi:hypothetical protein